MVDPAAYDKNLKDFIDGEGLHVNCTVNTHGHADHILGDSDFGYPVFIHELDAPCLSDAFKSMAFLAGLKVKAVKASRLLKDGDTVPVGTAELTVIHTPGHTPGGISLLHGNVLFSGDTLFMEGVGRTDLPGGDHQALVRSIREKLFVLPDETKVLPGHGPDTTIGFEKRNNPFLT